MLTNFNKENKQASYSRKLAQPVQKYIRCLHTAGSRAALSSGDLAFSLLSEPRDRKTHQPAAPTATPHVLELPKCRNELCDFPLKVDLPSRDNLTFFC